MNLYNFSNKTALITRASSGLGKQFAISLANLGARVIIAARRLDKLTELKQKLGNAVIAELDVTDAKLVNQTIKQLEEAGEKIDICVNNAGIAEKTAIFEETEESTDNFVNIIQTNLMGVWHVTKAVANHMKRNKIAGSIINIGSINGANKLRDQYTAYCASKAAVMQITKALVGELSPYNIRINCINPGLHRTPLTKDRVDNDKMRTEYEKLIPLSFIADPKELEGALLYLASNQASSYVTGSVITIDGGISWGGL